MKEKIKTFYCKCFNLDSIGYEYERDVICSSDSKTRNEINCSIVLNSIFKGRKYLLNWSSEALKLELIDQTLYNRIYTFNKKRNSVIHNLLYFNLPCKSITEDMLNVGNSEDRYSAMIFICKEGLDILYSIIGKNAHYSTIISLLNIEENEKETDSFLC